MYLTRHETGRVPPGFEAAVVFSNFGAVNCILEPALADGGIVALTVMGRFCLFETLYSLARGRWRIAARRWRGISSFRAGGRAHPLRYCRPAELEAAAGGFEAVSVTGIGALLPTSEAYGLWERWPRFFARVARLDRRLAHFSPAFADHYLIILRKRPA